MAQARHVGKIVLTVGDHALPVHSRTLPPEFPADATYLVTGGLGGFGLKIARWLADGGARHIALMGRTGLSSDEARQTVAGLEAAGARVAILQGDVSREEDLAAGLARLRAESPPLRGVVHAAMVLDDGLLVNLDRKKFRRVLDPKVRGAWNLHLLTRGDPLDFFVLFSSVSSLIGNRGQGNYAAGNAFLDSLCHYRRGLGLPALTVNWGYLGETGVLARNEPIARRFEEQGIRSFSPAQAVDALGRLLRSGAADMSVLNIDWDRLLEAQPGLKALPKFSQLVRREGRRGDAEDIRAEEETGLVAALVKAPPGDRAGLLESALAEQTARILGTSAAKIDRDRPLTEYGIDSLMAVELRNWLDNKLKITLPTMEIMRGPSIAGLAARLLKSLDEEAAHVPE
jgi:NAD(P)-dependent dehydrogenase (short-subunit alcohol dehydrogenase family)/acyl carrier protein